MKAKFIKTSMFMRNSLTGLVSLPGEVVDVQE